MKLMLKDCIVAAIIKAKSSVLQENFISFSEYNYFEKKLIERFEAENILIVVTLDISGDYFKQVDNIIYSTDTNSLEMVLAKTCNDDGAYSILMDEDFLLKILMDYKEQELNELNSKLNIDTPKMVRKQTKIPKRRYYDI